MKTLKFLVLVGSLVLAGGGGYVADRRPYPTVLPWATAREPTPPAAKPAGKIIYYRHPDGVPECSAAPKQTADGRPFVAVRQSEDVSFEPLEAVAEGPAPPASEKSSIYLDQLLRERRAACAAEGRSLTHSDLQEAIMVGAVERVRPKMMTVVAIMAGLVPILWSTGSGSEVMQRIAVPMIGGMVSSTILTLVVIPAVYGLVKGWRLSSSSAPKKVSQFNAAQPMVKGEQP